MLLIGRDNVQTEETDLLYITQLMREEVYNYHKNHCSSLCVCMLVEQEFNCKQIYHAKSNNQNLELNKIE